MDERRAVNRARGELERRRQEAYRARAAATLKIQRWYRQHRAIRARIPTNDDAASVRNPLELPAEESRTCTGSTSTSATLITTSQQEIQGISPMVSNEGGSALDNDDNLVQNHNTWSSSSQLEERSNSFDEFVNSEVAVARAMVDDRYIENLNDAQKKRVERLKAYRKISDNQIAASDTLQNESSSVSVGASPPSNLSNSSQVMAEVIPGHEPNEETTQSQTAEKIISSIPVRSTKKPLPNLRKRGLKPDVAKKADGPNKPQLTTNIEHVTQDVIAQVPNRRSKQKLSKPTSNQKKQWTMKEQHVAQKQQQTKEHRQLEQPDPIDQANDESDTCTESVKTIEKLVKIGGRSEMAGVNDTNMRNAGGDMSSEHSDVTPSSSSEGGGARTSKVQGTQTEAHTREEHTIKSGSKEQQTGQKVLKFASNVMWQNSNSTVHDPSTENSETKLCGIVKQPPHRTTMEMDQSQHEEELPPLKRSSATTRLTLECESGESDSAPLHKRRHKNTEEIYSDSDSFLNLGRPRSPHRSKLNKRSEARRQRIVDAALANYMDDSDSDDSSPEHLAYASGGQPRATRVSLGGTKFAPQDGGGYGAAYAKRRETNRKRIIRSLRTPQCKPKEKKEPAGYLQKFLRSSMGQNYHDALTTSSAPPSYSSGKGSWHTAWMSMGGLPRPGAGGLRTPPEHSPPPQEWVSIMNHASSVSLFEGSYDSPLHHHLAHRRRRPHHLHPLNAAPVVAIAGTRSKQPRASRPSHPKSYTYHYNQQQAVTQRMDNHSQTLSNHRRSLSHVIPSSWRTELYYEPNITYNRYRGGF